LAAVSEKEQLGAALEKLKYQYLTRPDNGARPELFVLVDNYDDWPNVVGSVTRATEYGELAELARKFGPEGLHFVIGGSLGILRAMDDLMKQVVSPRFGLGLDSGDAPGALGGRVRGGGSEEFPPGRGYVVKAGRVALVQTALPHDESDLEGSLDRWVDEIAAFYPQPARWYRDTHPPQPADAPVSPVAAPAK
jgi:hypothetical protein